MIVSGKVPSSVHKVRVPAAAAVNVNQSPSPTEAMLPGASPPTAMGVIPATVVVAAPPGALVVVVPPPPGPERCSV